MVALRSSTVNHKEFYGFQRFHILNTIYIQL
jgi:hypothetical protein